MMETNQEIRWSKQYDRRPTAGRTPIAGDWIDSVVSGWDGSTVVDFASGVSPLVKRELVDGIESYVAVDRSARVLRNLEDLWKKQDNSAEFVGIQSDLNQSVPLKPMKALFSVTYFHSSTLFDWIDNYALPGSEILIETHCREEPSDCFIPPDRCLKVGQLSNWFRNWTVMREEECTEEHPKSTRFYAKNK